MNCLSSNHDGDPCSKCGWQSKPVSMDDRILGRHNSTLTCEEIQEELQEYYNWYRKWVNEIMR